METLPAVIPEGHSPVGMSGAHRYMRCPGSVSIIRQLVRYEDDDPDYRLDGVLAHAIGAEALRRDCDPWEIAHEFRDLEKWKTLPTPEMLAALQVYVDYVRKFPGAPLVETTWHRPEFHQLAWGTIDYDAQTPSCLHIFDYKNGVGVNVEVEQNPQLMGYGYLRIGDALDEFPNDFPLKLHIVQPNGFHHHGPCRSWETTCGYVRDWAYRVLQPAIELALDPERGAWLEMGEWCQFCPAKLVCPAQHQITQAFASGLGGSVLGDVSDERLAQAFLMWPAVRAFGKALQEEVDRRNQRPGVPQLPGTKLVHKIAHRKWKDDAEKALVAASGDKAFEPKVLRSPAEYEKLGPTEKALTAEWAYKPDGGYTTTLEGDARERIVIKTSEERYSGLTQCKGCGADPTKGEAHKPNCTLVPQVLPPEEAPKRGRRKKT